ncbi:MAG: histidine phosphatase family protein [Acidimicrobiia bacterium]|nr:histidine phosphatase family protein [Acidimicrobiia bacterium]
MTRLILIRHAPTAETGKRLSGRLPGVPLTPAGRQAAAALARRLAGAPLAAVYTSPLLRCRQTAAAVAAPHRLVPLVRHHLADTDYGDWSGRALSAVRRTALWRLVRECPSQVTFPAGESLPAVQERAVAACESVGAAHPSATVALVTHSDVIATALAHYLGMPLDLFPRLAPAAASATILDLAGDGDVRVRALGVTAEDT